VVKKIVAQSFLAAFHKSSKLLPSTKSFKKCKRKRIKPRQKHKSDSL